MKGKGAGAFGAPRRKSVERVEQRRREAGDVVGLRLRDPLLHLVAIFALARAGIVHLPLNPTLAVADDDALLRRVGAVAVVADRADGVTAPWRAIVVDADLSFAAPGFRPASRSRAATAQTAASTAATVSLPPSHRIAGLSGARRARSVSRSATFIRQ